MFLHTGSLHPSGLWPDSLVPERTQIFLRKFFNLLDCCSDDRAEEYGDLFTEDASYLVSQISTIQGRQALVNQRIWAWKTWPGLQHCIHNVYTSDSSGLDIVTRGTFAICPADGRLRWGGSTAHMMLVERQARLQIKSLEICSDATPIMDMVPS